MDQESLFTNNFDTDDCIFGYSSLANQKYRN